MRDLNKSMIMGNVGRDIEVRSTSAGKSIGSFSVATSESWKGQDGEWQERTQWHKVVIINEKLLEFAQKHVRKGARIYVEGTSQTRQWEDKDGNKRETTEIVLRPFRGEIIPLDKREEQQADNGGGGDFDQDIPFSPDR